MSLNAMFAIILSIEIVITLMSNLPPDSTNTIFIPTSPSERYSQAIESGQFMPDEAQAQAVQELDRVWKELFSRYKATKTVFNRFRRDTTPKGVDMGGGVGRGKTWLMDQFYESIPFRRKTRLHFHHFMQQVHKELNKLSGQRNPLELVADQIYKNAVVICFDEFFVSNVTDAMILSDLFQKLFERSVTLVAT